MSEDKGLVAQLKRRKVVKLGHRLSLDMSSSEDEVDDKNKPCRLAKIEDIIDCSLSTTSAKLSHKDFNCIRMILLEST